MPDGFRLSDLRPPLDTSLDDNECACSLVRRCNLCTRSPATVHHDPPIPNGPTIPATYTDTNDVNHVCGCHLSSQCDGCGTCTSCDACYCEED